MIRPRDARVPRGLLGATALCIPMLLAACGGGVSTGDANRTPAGTPVNIAEVSLIPASASATPEEIPSAAPLPPADLPPSGEPPPLTPPSEYDLGADDLAAFAAEYREVFPGSADFDEAQFDAVGSHLCTYLMRHADAAGVVDVESALIEADMNEPGYTRDDWLSALEVANTHYCGEFLVDFAGTGG